ncbi:hypothetical protein CVT24_008384 [Panaeolus cyanescens]|uniref:Beta-xylanase n=1 Tax=Panaeolus cyanescens TaxID=181874 RepID=A0A409WCR4_9AGAR|nr:hypothetical protein CVT24_008384 [Panaeolus cyanescens]
MILSAKFLGLSALAAAVPVAFAQSPAWGQCGGIGWTGATVDIYYIPSEEKTFADDSMTIGFIFRHGSPTSTSSSPQPTGSGLAAIGKSIGWKFVGGADLGGKPNDQRFVSIFQSEYNMITPQSNMKWDATEPSRNVFNFGGADQLVAWAQQRSILVHDGWDVVNEIFNEDGTLRSSVFSNTLGESFVEIAFRAARAADPDAKLYISDYHIEETNAKSAALLNLVKKLKAQGIPIDGISVQGHLSAAQAFPSTFQANLAQFAAAGVEVAITQVDITTGTRPSQAILEQQQKYYEMMFAACKAVKACVGISMWGLEDTAVRRSTYSSGQLWDSNYNKKPAYDGAVAGMLS